MGDPDPFQALQEWLDSAAAQAAAAMTLMPAYAPMPECACGCGEPLASNRRKARYATSACKQRVYRRRLPAAAGRACICGCEERLSKNRKARYGTLACKQRAYRNRGRGRR